MLGISPALLSLKLIAETRIDTPMNEHPKARLAKPREAFVTRLHRIMPPRSFGAVFGWQTEHLRFNRLIGFNRRYGMAHTAQNKGKQKRQSEPNTVQHGKSVHSLFNQSRHRGDALFSR